MVGDNSSRDISPYKKSFRHSFIDDGREPILVTAPIYTGPLDDLYWSLDQPI